jgi:hypothetical protein
LPTLPDESSVKMMSATVPQSTNKQTKQQCQQQYHNLQTNKQTKQQCQQQYHNLQTNKQNNNVNNSTTIYKQTNKTTMLTTVPQSTCTNKTTMSATVPQSTNKQTKQQC